jgi:hypothetical protein
MSQQKPESGAASAAAGANDSNIIGDDISMNRIVDLLRDQQSASHYRQPEFLFEKQMMSTKINQLNAPLKA